MWLGTQCKRALIQILHSATALMLLYRLMEIRVESDFIHTHMAFASEHVERRISGEPVALMPLPARALRVQLEVAPGRCRASAATACNCKLQAMVHARQPIVPCAPAHCLLSQLVSVLTTCCTLLCTHTRAADGVQGDGDEAVATQLTA